MTDTVLVDRADGVVTVTLNRPDRSNALTGEMLGALVPVLTEIGDNPADRAVLLTGAGNAFCSGMDFSVRPDRGGTDFTRRIGRVCTLLHDLPQPVVAKVRGHAIGFGCNFALLADLVLASDDARFGQVFVERGLATDGGATWVLPRLIGLARAKEMLFFGERFSGAQAAEMGLVNRAVPDGELDALAADWVTRLARGPRLALSTIKRNLDASVGQSFGTVMDAEVSGQTVLFDSEDVKEGIRAFKARREPNFTA